MFTSTQIAAELEWLEGRVLWGMKVGLETMQVMLERLGNPERSFRSILIAGTNGKGSVASLLAHGLQQIPGQAPVGLYTSPHLVGVGERVRVNGSFLTLEHLAQHLAQIRFLSQDRQPTFFEVMTLVAILEFQRAGVDWAVFEVGLGGRLDSTNVLSPELCVLSSIGLDHVEILGSTEEAILAEKLGICRSDKVLLSGVQQKSLRPLLQKASAAQVFEIDAPSLWLEEIFQDLQLDLSQAKLRNQALAIMALEHLYPGGWTKEQLKSLISSFVWAGRFQWLDYRGVRILLDGAHNAAGAQALASELSVSKEKPTALIVAMVGDKDSSAWFETLGPVCGSIYFCKGRSERFRAPQDLQDLSGYQGALCSSWQKALDQALEDGHRTLLISGSLYLIGEVIEGLCGEVDCLADYRTLRPMVNERAVKVQEAPHA